MKGCPKCYGHDTVNSVNRNTMDELYQATVKKTEYPKRNGYNVVEMWECALNRALEEDEDMKHYFDHYHLTDPLEPRDALYGGRTNASKVYHRCEGDEQIKYVDFTSLYPHVNRSKTIPTGHPKITTENFDQNVSNYFGLIKCTVVPPHALFHLVLPYRTQGKLMFALCRTCADTCNQTRRRTRHSRNLVYHRIGKSVRRRLPFASNPRSMALPTKVRYAVQRVYRHVCQNQTGIKRLSQKLRHRRTKASLRGRYFGTPRDSIGSRQDCLQSGITCFGQAHVEFVLG